MGDEKKHEAPLTDKELIEIRQIIESDRRAKWLWSTVRAISVWVAAVIAGATLLLDSMASGIKHLIGKG